MRSGLARAALIALLGFLLVVGVLLSTLPSPEEREGSVLSTEPAGLRAAFLLLEGLGFPVASWDEAPSHLAGAGDLLVLGRVPEAPDLGPTPPEPPTPTTPNGGPAIARSRDPRHYRRFVEAGGTLVLFGIDQEGLERLVLQMDWPEPEDDVLLERADSFVERADIQGTGLTVAAKVDDHIDATRLPGASVLVCDEDGQALGVELELGPGRVLLFTLPLETFDNAALDEANALFLVRLFEALPRAERILFDEYVLGGWEPTSALVLAFSPRAALFSAHLLALLALLVWRAAWSGPFARDPEPLAAVSALARAEGAGALLASAGRWGLLARELRRGFLARWCVRAGLRPPEGGAGATPAEVEAGLAALTRLARGDARWLERARAAFSPADVPASEPALVALERELTALEEACFAPREVRPARERAPAI